MSEHKDLREAESVVSDPHIKLMMNEELAKQALTSTNVKIMMRIRCPDESLKVSEQRTQTPNLYQRMQKTLRRFFQ